MPFNLTTIRRLHSGLRSASTHASAYAHACIFSIALTTTALCGANNLVLQPATMDRSVNPCTDFYNYANGNWLATTTIPADRASYSAYDEITERNITALHDIAKQAEKARTPSSLAERIVGSYYRSGMDEAAIEAAGAAPLNPTLTLISGINRRSDILRVVAQLHKMGIPVLFDMTIEQDTRNSLRQIPHMTQGGLSLPDREYYLEQTSHMKTIRADFREHIATLFELLGDTPETATRHADTVLRIETQLARASISATALRDPGENYHLMRVTDLNTIAIHADWNRYFYEIGITTPGEINVAQPGFINRIGHMIAVLPLTDWKTYFRWQAIHQEAEYLSSAFVEADFDFFGRTLTGADQLPPRWKRVMTTIDENVGDALSQLFVEHHFKPEAKSSVLTMTTHIKQAMAENINQLDWLSADTKLRALNKLRHIVVKIGYPDQWRDYRTLDIDTRPNAYTDPHLFFNTNRRAFTFEFNRMLAKMGRPVDRNEWVMNAPAVNAYYHMLLNEIVFPAGILQPQYYHPSADPASNYGSIGAVIGHELVHAFDDRGRQFDADGNIKNWWTLQDEQQFITRAALIERQFNEFMPIDQLPINGKLTMGENIADLGGLKLALKAFKKTQQTQPQARLIDDLTPDQRFFVAFAQSFRGLTRPEKLRLQLATDTHSPDFARVLGPIANMPEFAQAFSCSAADSPLLPIEKRVAIW